MESRLLLNVIVAEGAAILELLSGEDQTLLVRWDTGELSDYDDEPVKPSHSPLLVLDLGLDIVDGVRGLNLEGDGFTRKAVEGTRSVKVYLRIERLEAYVLIEQVCGTSC